MVTKGTPFLGGMKARPEGIQKGETAAIFSGVNVDKSAIEDSKEGWASAIKSLDVADSAIDVSSIRPKGPSLKKSLGSSEGIPPTIPEVVTSKPIEYVEVETLGANAMVPFGYYCTGCTHLVESTDIFVLSRCHGFDVDLVRENAQIRKFLICHLRSLKDDRGNFESFR